jgi:inositol-hexakisphosphate/diphosphoinositol-pentakisphosphate 1-kinase
MINLWDLGVSANFSQEIVQDLEEMQASDDAKSFIYFTKESHIYTLLNCILEGGITTKIKRSAIPELDYLSQICFELYESENKTPPDAQDVAKYAYSIRITISPGCHTFDPLDVQLDSKHCISCAPRRSLTAHADWKEVIETLRAKFHTVKLPKSFLAVNLSESHTFHKKDEIGHEGGAATDSSAVPSDVVISSLDHPNPPEFETKHFDNGAEEGIDPIDTSHLNPLTPEPGPETKQRDVPPTPDSQSS